VCFPVTVFSWLITLFGVWVEAHTNIE